MKRIIEDDQLILYYGDEKVLTMTEYQEDQTVRVVLDGSLKSETVFDLQDELTALTILGMDIRLNMEKVTYLSSACVRAMLIVQQKMDTLGKGTLTLEKVPCSIYKELESTGASELFMIEE